MLKQLRKQLLKIGCIRRHVEAYKREQKRQKDDRLFARIMMAGQALHFDDSAVVVGYMDTRMIGQRPVQPLYIDSTNWGVEAK
jgi:hypothetical protein